MLTLLLALQAGAAVAAPAPCRIETVAESGSDILIGICGKRAVRLGSAKGSETAVHQGTGTAVTVLRDGPSPHVLTIRSTGEDQILLEDVTGDLARQAGRAVDAGLADLVVDIAGFRDDGVIAIRPLAASRGGASATAQILVDAMIAQEAARQAQAPATPPIVDVVPEGRGPVSK